MTDFGRRVTGVGDMLKSVYDTDDDGYVDGLKDHAELHQAAGDEEIAVTGLVGTTPRALLGDATAGRVYRSIDLAIQNGTNNNTINVTVASEFNGHAIAETDNIAKNVTTGDFSLDSAGERLTIKSTGIPVYVVHVFGRIHRNTTGQPISPWPLKSAGEIAIFIRTAEAGAALDWTGLVDSGLICLRLDYITDA